MPTLPPVAPAAPAAAGPATDQPDVLVDAATGTVPEPDGLVVDGGSGRPDLINTRGLRWLFISANLLTWPSVFAGPVAVVALVLLSVVALVSWSVLADVNARRAKPSTVHVDAPSPLSAALWWLSPILLAVVLGAASIPLESWLDGRRGSNQQETNDMIEVAFRLVAVVAFLITWYGPYGHLARTATWVGGNAGRVRQWFWVPIVVGIATAVVFVFSSMSMSDDLVDGDISSVDGLRVLLTVGLLALPSLTWLYLGNRAMREIERATSMTTVSGGGTLDAAAITERFRLAAERETAGT